MRITFVMPKLNMKSSTTADILLKSKILKELGHEVRIITTFSVQNNTEGHLPFEVYEENTNDMRLIPLQLFAVRLLKKYASTTDIFYLTSDTYFFGGGWYRRFVRNSKPVVGYINGYMDFVEVFFKKAPLWPGMYLKKETGQINFFHSVKYKIRILSERIIGIWLMNGMDLFFVMSKTVTDYYVQAGISRKKTVVMSDFYDMNFLQERAIQASPFLSYSKDTFHLLFTGRIYMDKGPDLIIRAFSQMKYRDKSMLHMVGDGPQRTELELYVRGHGLGDRVIFHGWKSGDELLAFYQHADVYTQVTRLPEPLNRVGVEALAVGIPMVATNTSGEQWFSEVAKTFRHGDVDDMARVLEYMYENPEERKKMSRRARERAKDFDYKKLGRVLEDQLKHLNI